jgi:Flp pilus assembly protein TadD
MQVHPTGEELLADLQRRIRGGDRTGARAVIRRKPESAHAHRYLALLQLAEGRPGSALLQATRACELAPADPRTWSDLGRAHARAGRFGDAARAFECSLRVDSRHADAWHNLGIARRRLGEDEGAFQALKSAVMLDPGCAQAWLALGNLLLDGGRRDDALQCFERAAATGTRP